MSLAMPNRCIDCRRDAGEFWLCEACFLGEERLAEVIPISSRPTEEKR